MDALYTSYNKLLISIHALREEGDGHHLKRKAAFRRFLSTPSARRATADCCGKLGGICISIHALREEGDASTTRM